MKISVSHIMFCSTDVPRAIVFYRDLVGLAVQMERPEFAFLDAGSVTLALRAVSDAEGVATGSNEVVLGVDGVREAHAEMGECGLTFLNEPRNVTGDRWATNFRDPDGHLLSIFGPESRA
jgi:catechol 2,3-dioxygenase-like lactoylglutathione lyase family enzyme